MRRIQDLITIYCHYFYDSSKSPKRLRNTDSRRVAARGFQLLLARAPHEIFVSSMAKTRTTKGKFCDHLKRKFRLSVDKNSPYQTYLAVPLRDRMEKLFFPVNISSK